MNNSVAISSSCMRESLTRLEIDISRPPASGSTLSAETVIKYKGLEFGVLDQEGFLELLVIYNDLGCLLTSLLLRLAAEQLAQPNDGRSDMMT